MRRIFILFTSMVLVVTSCVRYQEPQTDKDKPSEDLVLDFAFETRTERTITVTAIIELGKGAAGVLFIVFVENPYGEEGERNSEILPIYQGYTEASGKLTIPINIPNSTERIYVLPEYAGFGPMLDFSTKDFGESLSLDFKGTQLPEGTKTKAATKASVAPRDAIKKGVNYNFYTYYTESEYNAADGVLDSGCELVSYEALSTEFKSMVNDWFPESGFNYSSELTTDSDLYIASDDTEVWLTYIGDGGYSNNNPNIWNSLYFYTYTDATKPNATYFEPGLIAKTNAIQLTAAFINTYPDKTASGTKVQLLYWNGTKYVSSFPVGTYIGFALVNFGYKKSNGTVGFNIERGKEKFTTHTLNTDGQIHGIFQWSDLYQCFVLGMENYNVKDADFNDLLLKITTSKKADLAVERPTPNVSAPEYSYAGTVAYEDTWPDKGDYDMNDFVTDYQYDLIKVAGTNTISGIRVTFHPLAAGASQVNGFGVQIPILTTNIASVTGGTLEDGQTLATTIVYDDVKSAFGGVEGFVNTVHGKPVISASTAVIEYTFVTPLNEKNVYFSGINPFLYKAEDRGREIHLVNYAPTLKANMNTFGTLYDKSVPSSGVYYRMDNTFPWAVDIAKSHLTVWKYPREKINIKDTYTHFGGWVDNPQIVWYDATVADNIVPENIFVNVEE
ncbi:MAG: LruC domain-containing protein [Bacteroidales bacterium]|nr:LruC domain-containing protein [Bacteroidales bacterium]